MSKVFTIMLRPHGELTGLMLYQARAKDFNSAVLLMRMQGIVPANDILSYTDRPTWPFLKGIVWPRSVDAKNADIVKQSAKRSFFAPIICWFKRQHVLTRYGDHGDYCKRCKGVFSQ